MSETPTPPLPAQASPAPASLAQASPADLSRADLRPEASGPDLARDGFRGAAASEPGSVESGPAAPDLALADLVAAGLVTHEMICDPARLGGEAPALDRLCALVGGAIYRIGPFHYAFRATPGDLGGALAGLAVDDWTGALEAALRETLGPEAAWLSATDLLSDALALDTGPEAAAAVPEGALALLRGRAGAVAEGLALAPAGSRAVIDAAYASETARLTAARARDIAAELGREMARDMARDMACELAREMTREISGELTAGLMAAITAEIRTGIRAEIAGDIARDLAGARSGPERAEEVAGLLAGIAERLGALEARAAAREDDPGAAPSGELGRGIGRIEAALETVAARLDLGETRGDLLGEHLAEHLTLRLGAVLAPPSRAARRPAPGAGPACDAEFDPDGDAEPGPEFEETLALALAEFLARVERATTDPAPSRPL